MERITKQALGGYWVEPDAVLPREQGFGGAAIECRQQERIAGELKALRLAGKQKTVRFRQLLANKVTNQNIIVMLEMHP